MMRAAKFLLAGAIVLLAACGRQAPARLTTSGPPAAQVIPAKPPAAVKPVCVTPPPSPRPVYLQRVADARQLLETDAIVSRQADGAAKEAASDLRASQGQLKDDEAVLEQALATASDMKQRLDHDTMMARLGVLAPMLVDQSRIAYAQARAAVQSAQSASDNARDDVQLLLARRRQFDARAAAARKALQHAASELRQARHELSTM
ncbi:MAG: hypothetical protein IT166_16365 [Bryobacterales bacterium]|nr:hypothetical protein [Bryobacterales bacterium]